MLSARMPDLAALETLLAVARFGSINAGAAELGVSQQAVSARIRAMEAHTGLALLARSPRGSTLTPDGVTLAAWAGRLVDLAAEVDAGLAALRTDHAVQLRVSASLTVAEQLMPGWLVTLAATGTRADVVLSSVNSVTVAEQVRSGQADLGFVEGARAPSGLTARVIGTDSLVIAVHPDHPWARRRRPLTASDLAEAPLVTREQGSGTQEVFVAAMREALGDKAEFGGQALALPTTAAMRATVLSGTRAAVLSRLTVAEDLAAGRLHAVPTTGLRFERSLRAVWAGGRLPPAGPARALVAVAAHASDG